MKVKLNLSGHKNESLDQLGFLDVGAIHVNLADKELPKKVEKFLAEHIESKDTVEIALPGLSMLTALMITSIHGITGQFPVVVTLVRQENKTYAAGESIDLQKVRDNMRVARGAVVL